MWVVFNALPPAGCGTHEFACVSGSPKCIADWRKCDQRADCHDGSDEADFCRGKVILFKL